MQETWVQTLGRSPGEGDGNPPQYSCLDNSVDRGAWWAIVHGVIRVRHDQATNTHTHTHEVATFGCFRYGCQVVGLVVSPLDLSVSVHTIVAFF